MQKYILRVRPVKRNTKVTERTSPLGQFGKRIGRQRVEQTFHISDGSGFLHEVVEGIHELVVRHLEHNQASSKMSGFFPLSEMTLEVSTSNLFCQGPTVDLEFSSMIVPRILFS